MHNVQIKLITDANARFQSMADAGEKPQYSGAFVGTPIGEVRVYGDHRVSNPNSFGRHVRHTWRLNNKVISAAKLEEMLK